jgi:hypothetical protein
VFQNKLISSLASRVPELPPALIFAAGATNLKTAVDPKFLTAVMSVYNGALVAAFQVGGTGRGRTFAYVVRVANKAK